MNTTELIKALAKAEKISQAKAKKIIKAFIESIGHTLSDGKKIVFSNFGSFLTHKYPSKTIHDPRGRGHKLLMLPTNVIKWHPSPRVKHHINKKTADDKPTTKTDHDQTADKSAISGTEVKIQTKTKNPIDFSDLTKDSLIETDEPKADGKTKTTLDHNTTELPDNIVTIKTETHQPKAEPESDQVFASDKKDQPEKIDSEPPPTTQPQQSAGLTENQIGEITKSQTRPKISFEDFVRKTKDDVLSTTPANEQPPEKPDFSAGSSDELDQAKQEALSDDQKSLGSSKNNPYFGNVAVEFIDLSKVSVDKNVLALIPEKIARQFQIAPIADNGNVLTVAMIDPEDLETIELIKKQTGREVIPKLTIQSDLSRVLDQYSGVESEVSEAINQSENEIKDTTDAKVIAESKQQKIIEDAPVARIVSSLIKRAVRELASDIHIEPTENGLDVRFRIDGVLHKKVTIPKDIQASVTSRIKILAGIKIDESRLPQDGRIAMSIDNRKVDFRISTMPTAFGEKIVMRILDKSTGVLSLEALGLRNRGFEVVENSIHKSHGMTLVTGPTGSGKTTTLYAIIDRLLDVAVNIVTLEDPIEYQMPGINQSQVNPEIDYTFANGLRSILRQDPDVVMIGEIRDKDTAEMAVNAALTGHVVLSTLHTNDAAGAGPRLIDMGVEPFLITSSLNTVIAQRLARKVCKECKEIAKVSDKEIEEVKKEIAKMPADARKKWEGKKLVFYKGKGCDECHNTGYKGRIGIYEVLDVNQKIQNLLLSRETSSKITEAAIFDGMLTMKQEGIDKALDGLTSLEEVWRVTKD